MEKAVFRSGHRLQGQQGQLVLLLLLLGRGDDLVLVPVVGLTRVSHLFDAKAETQDVIIFPRDLRSLWLFNARVGLCTKAYKILEAFNVVGQIF